MSYLQEMIGDIWGVAKQLDALVVVPTNGDVRRDGRAVMGRGLAAQAAARWPDLPAALGGRLRRLGGAVFYFPDCEAFSFPVKRHWPDRADLALIARSAVDLARLAPLVTDRRVCLPRPGCGNGRLDWARVRPVIADALAGEQFVVVDRAP